jgi:ABC-type glycerol-3-phosphate transport system substrate-binding protein
VNAQLSRRSVLKRAASLGLTPLAGAMSKIAPRIAAAAGAELTVLNPSRGLAKALGALAEKYGKDRDVKVTVDTPGPVDYPKKLLAASQTNTMPDIFVAGAASSGAMAPYYKAGWALPLKPELDKGWKQSFAPVALDLVEWRTGNPFGVAPGIYYVPLELGSFGLLYNPAHLEKAKLDPKRLPTTVPQLMEALTAVKTAGIGPLTTSVDAIPILVQSHVSNWLTDEEIDATHAGRRPWAGQAYEKALQLFVDLRDGHLLLNNSINGPWAEMEKSFYNVREVAMIYDGAWSIGVQRATAPDFTAYGSLRLPKAADARHDQRSVGVADRNFAVNAKGKHVEESLAFVKWLSDKEQAQFFLETVPILPTNPAALADPSKVPPQFNAFAAQAAGAQKVSTPRVQRVDEALTKGVQALLLKQKTVAQILEDADRAQKG